MLIHFSKPHLPSLSSLLLPSEPLHTKNHKLKAAEPGSSGWEHFPLQKELSYWTSHFKNVCFFVISQLREFCCHFLHREGRKALCSLLGWPQAMGKCTAFWLLGWHQTLNSCHMTLPPGSLPGPALPLTQRPPEHPCSPLSQFYPSFTYCLAGP